MSGGHERHSEEREFDPGCERCRARLQAKARADLRQMLVEKGLTEERTAEFLAGLDQIGAAFKADLKRRGARGRG